MGFATKADLFFEIGNAGDDLVDLLRQTALVFAGGCQQTLLFDETGSGAHNLFLGARLLIVEANSFRIESAHSTLEDPHLLIEASTLRSSGFSPFFRESCFGTSSIELAQCIGGFFAAAGEAVGSVLDRLLELDTACFEL